MSASIDDELKKIFSTFDERDKEKEQKRQETQERRLHIRKEFHDITSKIIEPVMMMFSKKLDNEGHYSSVKLDKLKIAGIKHPTPYASLAFLPKGYQRKSSDHFDVPNITFYLNVEKEVITISENTILGWGSKGPTGISYQLNVITKEDVSRDILNVIKKVFARVT
jgi:hypothetical protein